MAIITDGRQAFIGTSDSITGENFDNIELVWRDGQPYQKVPGSSAVASQKVLVDSNSNRFIRNANDPEVYSVKGRLNDPPANPAQGDRYIVQVGTGAWLNLNDDVVEYDTDFSWSVVREMTSSTIGFSVYNEADGSVWSYTNTGWQQGVLASGIAAGSLSLRSLDTIPSITVDGQFDSPNDVAATDAIILISATPTAGTIFEGNANRIAFKVSGTWVQPFTAPKNEQVVRRNDVKRNYSWNGTEWSDVGGNAINIGLHTCILSPGQFLDIPNAVVPLAFDNNTGETGTKRTITPASTTTWLDIVMEDILIEFTMQNNDPSIADFDLYVSSRRNYLNPQIQFQLLVGTTPVIDLNTDAFLRASNQTAIAGIQPDAGTRIHLPGTDTGDLDGDWRKLLRRTPMDFRYGIRKTVRMAAQTTGRNISMRMGFRYGLNQNTNMWRADIGNPNALIPFSNISAASGQIRIIEQAN